MTITALPTPPSSADPANFAARGDAFLGALPQMVTEINADLLNIAGTYNGTSTTSVTLGTGDKSFTTQTGLAFQPGQPVVAASTTTPTNNGVGIVKSYNSGTGALVITVSAISGSGTIAAWTISLLPSTTASVMRGQLGGLTLSTAGSSATFGIAAGQAADSANSVLMNLSSAYTKTTSAWAVGSSNGSLDTGTIANSTWYHVYLIRRPDTGVVDVIISTNAAAPALPTNYTQYRRIGSMLTNGSAQWLRFFQIGDKFLWAASVSDFASTGPTTSTLFALSVPLGIQVDALLNVIGLNTGGSGIGYGLAYSPDQTVVTASITNTNFSWLSSNNVGAANLAVRTNTARQIYVSSSGWSGGTFTLNLTTQGYIDRRGRDD